MSTDMAAHGADVDAGTQKDGLALDKLNSESRDLSEKKRLLSGCCGVF